MKHAEAVVLEKEHIAAEEPTPTPSPSAQPDSETKASEERPLAADEIAVDGYVMKADARGTGRDPRASKDEQWRVAVRTVTDGRTFTVQTDRAHFDAVKEGDRVRVSYRVGKYTDTVWFSTLE